MALAAYNIRVLDGGRLATDVWIEVKREQAGQPLEPIYSDREGTVPLGNPFFSPTGKQRVHARGGAFQVRAYKAGFEDVQRYVGIGLASESDLTALTPAGDWDSGTTYSIGNYVYHEGYTWASLIDSNLNNEPPYADSPLGSDASWMFVPTTQGPSGVGDKYDLGVSPIVGKPDPSETVLRHVFTSTIEFAADMTGSRASADVASTGSAVFSIEKNDVEIATVTFATSDAGVFESVDSPAAPVSFEADDVLKIVAPGTQDATLSDISITLLGSR